MSAKRPTIYVIAGCNGAGKTTFAKAFLPHEVRCLNFLNADMIAQGLSPLDTKAVALKAGRLLLGEFRSFAARGKTFAIESTLSGVTYVSLLNRSRQKGFRIHIHYLWLPNPAVPIARVRERVKLGGHNVSVADIRRRFIRSLKYFARDYAPLADRWAVWDNQTSPPRLMAESETCPSDKLNAIIGL